MFKKAALRLTLQYTIILFMAVFIFSISIYLYMNQTFGNNYVDHFNARDSDQTNSIDAQEVADAGLNKLQNGLLILDGGVLMIIPLLSYAMARRAMRPIREGYEQQEAFTDNASHELRTPLAIIQGELELALQKSRSPKEYAAAIRQSLTETQALIALTDHLLFLSRGDIHNAHQDFKTLPLRKVVESAMQGLNLALHKKQCIDVKIAPKTTVYGNLPLLKHALSNILSNAIKFTAADGRISVSGSSAGKKAELVIRDNGKGMSKQDQAHVFDRFWRAEHSRTTEGHGLGLPIVKQIIALHDGNIEINSTEQVGTTVIIHLPVGKQLLNKR